MYSRNIAFLIAAPYSGATLFSILMNQHPAISSDGEMFPFERGNKILCSCGRLQKDCAYYRTVASSMLTENKRNYDDNLFYYVPRYSQNYYLSRAFEGFWLNTFAHKLRNFLCTSISKLKNIEDEFIEIHMQFYSKSLDLRNARVYFDGSKSLRRAELFAGRNLTTKLIHLIRDGRAFCNSFIKNKGLHRRNLALGAKVWEKSIRKVDILRKRFPEVEILDVRYNDLCNSTESELKRIWGFLGVDFDRGFLEYHAKDMHIVGNRMRNEYNGLIREDHSWKRQLKNDEIKVLNKLMIHGLKRFDFL